jgi:rhodanese-related sulfurtransferase
MERISIDKLHELAANLGEDELILDVRTPEEFAEGHIPGARNQDHEQVTQIADELKNYKTVYVHCKMGGRAQRASEALDMEGLDNIVCVSDGGMARWIEMGWEVER